MTYHPDRIQNPLARTGPRGSGQFKEITWDEAIKQLVTQLSPLQTNKQENGLTFITSPLRGQRKAILQEFMTAFKGSQSIEFALFDDKVGSAANGNGFNHSGPYTVDLAQSNYVISFGADFLGTWNSPVAQSAAFGKMRKGRAGLRGKFIHVEPRMSLTAASADEWIPCTPGTEGVFALGLAHVILAEKLRPSGGGGSAGALIDGWSGGLADYAPEKIAPQTGVPAATITRIAREAAAQGPAVAMIGGAASAHTNGFFNALAVNALNELLGSVSKPGGINFAPAAQSERRESVCTGKRKRHGGRSAGDCRAHSRSVGFGQGTSALRREPGVRDADSRPARETPLAKFHSSRASEVLLTRPARCADLILPDHSPLESWLDDAPPSGSALTVASLAPPAMNPLHNTRAMPDVLLQVAQQLGGDAAKALPWKTYEAVLKESFSSLQKQKGSIESADADEFWKKAQAQGGWWSTDVKPVSVERREKKWNCGEKHRAAV